jgi:hypothetical protein
MNRKVRLEAAVPAFCAGTTCAGTLAVPERHGSVKVGDAV